MGNAQLELGQSLGRHGVNGSCVAWHGMAWCGLQVQTGGIFAVVHSQPLRKMRVRIGIRPCTDKMKGKNSRHHLALATEANVSTCLYLFALAFVFVLKGKSAHVLNVLGLSVRLADRRGSAGRREGHYAEA